MATRERRRAGHARHGLVAVHEAPTEDRLVVLAALRQLPDPIRETVALFYLEDLSIERIAAETGSPAGTIKARLHRGRSMLADLLRSLEWQAPAYQDGGAP